MAENALKADLIKFNAHKIHINYEVFRFEYWEICAEHIPVVPVASTLYKWTIHKLNAQSDTGRQFNITHFDIFRFSIKSGFFFVLF